MGKTKYVKTEGIKIGKDSIAEISDLLKDKEDVKWFHWDIKDEKLCLKLWDSACSYWDVCQLDFGRYIKITPKHILIYESENIKICEAYSLAITENITRLILAGNIHKIVLYPITLNDEDIIDIETKTGEVFYHKNPQESVAVLDEDGDFVELIHKNNHTLVYEAMLNNGYTEVNDDD